MKRLVPPAPQIMVAVSGGFDPIHKGHVRMIRAAANYGTVVVIANSDEWLMRKKVARPSALVFFGGRNRCRSPFFFPFPHCGHGYLPISQVAR